VLNHFPLIFSAEPFSIEQGHSFAKWLRQGRQGYSLICMEARAHAVAHVGGRWVSAQALGACGSVVGSFSGTRGSIARGVQAHMVAWLGQTVPDWSR
jgi:hypothetical protein